LKVKDVGLPDELIMTVVLIAVYDEEDDTVSTRRPARNRSLSGSRVLASWVSRSQISYLSEERRSGSLASTPPPLHLLTA